MIPTLLLQISTPTTIVSVPRQSYVSLPVASEELERKRKGGLWQHQGGRQQRLRD